MEAGVLENNNPSLSFNHLQQHQNQHPSSGGNDDDLDVTSTSSLLQYASTQLLQSTEYLPCGGLSDDTTDTTTSCVPLFFLQFLVIMLYWFYGETSVDSFFIKMILNSR